MAFDENSGLWTISVAVHLVRMRLGPRRLEFNNSQFQRLLIRDLSIYQEKHLYNGLQLNELYIPTPNSKCVSIIASMYNLTFQIL